MEPGKGSSTQAPATSRHTQAGLLRFLPHEEESGECYWHHRPGLHRPRAGSLCSTLLPHHGYVGDSVGAAGTVSRSLASAPQSISVAPTDHQTRLCDSVRPASPQVQGHPVHFSQTRRCSCLACGNRSPTGEGRDRAGPSSRYEVRLFSPYFIVPKKGGGLRPILDLRVLNRALHKLPFKMLTQKRIFGCVRLLDWFAAIDLKDAYFHVSILPRHRPFLRFAFKGQAYQYKVLPFGLSLSPRVETRHLPGSDNTGLPQDLQAVVRSLVPSGRSAPGAGIQTCCGIHRSLDHRLGSHVQRARSIRGLDGSPTALAYQLPRVASSTPCPGPSQRAPSAQGRSGPYGQHCDHCVYQPARRFALPSHVATRPPPPPLDSEASEVPSCHPHPRSVQSGSRRAVSSSTSRRVETPSPGGSADLGTVRSCSGRPVCISRNHPLPRVLLPNRGNAQHGCTGTQLAPGPAQICVPPSEPTSTDTVQDQGGRGAGLVSGSILAQQDLVPGTHAPRDSPSLANSSEEGSAFSETGHPMAPASGPVETPRMVPGWDAEVLADLPQEVALTIISARAPSTRRAYTLKWNLFVEWCSSHQEDPRRCSIRAVLSFLQQGLERRLSPSTLKVYVAAISAYHDPVEGKSVGKHNLVVRFLRGARRLNPPRPPSLPSWDLALVLRALITAPFEPLQSVKLKFLSMKTLLLTALASIKRVGDLQAFSVDDSCLQFGPADSSATLRPRPGYVPKVPTTPFRDQVVNLQALPLEEADPALALLCPVRALRQYTDRTQSFRTSEQLFVCYGGQQKGKAVSKQRMAHWIVDAITLAYEAKGVPCPLRLHAHSTRGVASSWALARGASLADICRAAGWATPNTFARFYSLRVEPVSSCVLTSNR